MILFRTIQSIHKIVLLVPLTITLLSFNNIAGSPQSQSGKTNATSERLEKIRTQMVKRLKEIDKLKAKGIIGENRTGYLEPTPPNKKKLDKKQTELLKAENKDRKEIYTILAQRTKTTLLQVQAVRADIIRKKSKKGFWLQDKKGKWYKKTKDPTPTTK